METRARDSDKEVHQDSDSDCYLFPKEKVFVNAVDDWEMIAVSKRSMSLLPQKEALRIELNHLKRRQSHGQRFIVFAGR